MMSTEFLCLRNGLLREEGVRFIFMSIFFGRYQGYYDGS